MVKRVSIGPFPPDPWWNHNLSKFKRDSLRYWDRKPASLLATTEINLKLRTVEEQGSLDFLELLGRARRRACVTSSQRRVLDCGAGIGRHVSRVLLKLSGVNRVDLLEPARRLRAKARELLAGQDGVGRIFAKPLQEFTPVAGYDIIWLSWVLMYIPDVEVVAFLSRCRGRLAAGGCLAVKDNVEDRKREEQLDEEDYCVTRKADHFEALFRAGGFRVLVKRWQRSWPTAHGRFPVMMWGLIPT